MNIIEMILKLVGSGNMLGRISSLLGVNQEQAGKAVNAAVPSLLAGLIGSASKPDGAARLSGLLSKQDPGLLDNLPNLLSQGASAGAGASNPLSSLLGGGGLGEMAGALSKFSGVGEGGAGKLLGMLAPVVLGVVGKQAKGLDASGLANMLAGQKANVAAAMPAGLGNLLSSAVPGLGDIMGGASKAASAVADTASSAAKAAGAAAQQAGRATEAAGSSVMKWLLPIIIVVLAVVLLPRLFCSKAPPPGGVEELGSAAFVGDVTGGINIATEGVASLKAEASAAAALPKLQELNVKLVGLKATWSALPASAQTAASDTLRPLVAKLRDTLKPVLDLPVVGDKVKPVVDEMLGSLDTFAPAAP